MLRQSSRYGCGLACSLPLLEEVLLGLRKADTIGQAQDHVGVNVPVFTRVESIRSRSASNFDSIEAGTEVLLPALCRPF